MSGGNGADKLNGDAGDDSVDGGAGNDVINGGEGADTLLGQAGADKLNGDAGDDSVDGGAGNDVINGGEGADTLLGGANDDTINGGDGDDSIDGGTSYDLIDGGSGNDTIDGWWGVDTITGGEGDDTLTGTDNPNIPNQTDTFVFNFNWETVDLGFAVNVTQSQFSTGYSAWLQSLIDTYDLGTDADEDGVVEFGLNQNEEGGTPWIEGVSDAELELLFSASESIGVTTGNTQKERWYSSSFDQVSSSDGHDTITDFQWGSDTLQLIGVETMDLETFDRWFDVTVVEGNTVFSLADGSWSVTLVGVTEKDIDDFYDTFVIA